MLRILWLGSSICIYKVQIEEPNWRIIMQATLDANTNVITIGSTSIELTQGHIFNRFSSRKAETLLKKWLLTANLINGDTHVQIVGLHQ